ncbi:MAG: ParB N-terminal domain-containing protein [Clostridia bacterium]|nr:ParB N-terminal domain-containing protein [Clostridia bacterium]
MSAIINHMINNTEVNQSYAAAIDNTTLADAIMANVPEVCGVYYKDLPLALLDVHPTIQRDLSDHYLKIAENFDINKCDPLTVSWKENGTFLIIDGQHRFRAALQKGITTLPCRVFKDLTAEEEAKMFYTQNENNKRLTPRDMLRAKLTVKEEVAVSLKNLCDRHGVFLFKTGEFDVPYLKDVSGMEKLIRIWGEDLAETVFQFVEIAGWQNELNGYSSNSLRPIITFWRKLYIQRGHEDPTEDVLEVARTISGMPFDQLVATANAMFPYCTTHMAVISLYRKIFDSHYNPDVFLLTDVQPESVNSRQTNIA